MTEYDLELYCQMINLSKQKERFSNPEYVWWMEKLINALEEKLIE
jgi:hypothetical protein